MDFGWVRGMRMERGNPKIKLLRGYCYYYTRLNYILSLHIVLF
jgi:hypothetical protein